MVVSGDVYDRALPPVDAVALADEAFHRLARLARPGRDHQRQPRLRARRLGFNARLVDARRRAPAHRRRPASTSRCCSRTSTARSRSTASPTSSPTSSPAPGTCRRAPTRRPWPRRWTASAPTSPRARPAPGRWCWHTPSSPAACPARASATSPSAASRVVPLELFDGIDYTALGHLHGRADPDRDGPLQRLPDRLLLLRGRPPQGVLAGRPRRGRVRRSHASSPPPCLGALARLEGTIEELLDDPTVHARHEDSWVQATLTDAVRPPQAMERLRARFPHALALRFAPSGGEQDAARACAPPGGPPTTSPSTSSPTSAASAGRPRRSPTSCARPLECCSEDPDLVVARDAVVSG